MLLYKGKNKKILPLLVTFKRFSLNKKKSEKKFDFETISLLRKKFFKNTFLNVFFEWFNSFENKQKRLKSKEKIDITNQNERLVALIYKDDHKDNQEDSCKQIFVELVKERLHEIKELTNEINENNSMYYCFKGNTARIL